jgi:hypothetical protein
MSSAILYLGFLVGSYPCALLGQIFPINRAAGILIFLWGTCLLLTIVCTEYRGLYAQRFFLGLLEGGISPIFMMVVGGWYTKCMFPPGCFLDRSALQRSYADILAQPKAEQALRMGVSQTPQPEHSIMGKT